MDVVYVCATIYMGILVSCMNDHTFLPITSWLHLEISDPSHNEVCCCERHLLSSGYLAASVKKCNFMLSDTPSSDTYLHFLRENGDNKAHIHVSTKLCFFFSLQWNVWIYNEADIWRCGQGATAGREQRSRDPLNERINPQTTPLWGRTVTFYSVTFSEPWLITLQSFSQCASVSQTVKGWQVWLAWAPQPWICS